MLLSCAVASIALELSARFYKEEWRWLNFASELHELRRAAYPAQFSPLLGWEPRPGRHPTNVWGHRITILPDGVRSNGSTAPPARNAILAVGDSFTFGDEVEDHDTWPAQLERLTQTPVVNGGVFGYGVDQTFLRMEVLADRFRPSTVIFSFIPDDVHRSERSMRSSTAKPYFEPTGDNDLRLRSEHVQQAPGSTGLGLVQRISGYSFLFHRLMIRVLPGRWPAGPGQSLTAHSSGIDVACRLFQRLGPFARARDAKMVLLVQYSVIITEDDARVVKRVLPCVNPQNVVVIDLAAPLERLKAQNPSRYSRLFKGHMTREGNQLVAEELARIVRGLSDDRSAKQ